MWSLLFLSMSDWLTLFLSSLCVRHVHRVSHLPADDTHMWDGNIWRIQGIRWLITPNMYSLYQPILGVVTADSLMLSSLLLCYIPTIQPNLSVSAASSLDHPLFLLPNFWLCPQHTSGCEHRGLPKHHSGLPAATGERPCEKAVLLLSSQCGYIMTDHTVIHIIAATLVFPNWLSAPCADLLLTVFLWFPQPDNFPYKEEIAALSNVCLVLIVLIFISCILGFKVKLSYIFDSQWQTPPEAEMSLFHLDITVHSCRGL